MNEGSMYYPYQYSQQMRPAPRQVETPYYGMQMTSTPLQNYIKGRPVVSIDEARAAQIDLDGSLYVFTDVNNKKIYTKQINQDGSANFFVYERIEDANAGNPSYVTREEFNKVISQINDAFSRVASSRPQPSERKAAPAQEFNI